MNAPESASSELATGGPASPELPSWAHKWARHAGSWRPGGFDDADVASRAAVILGLAAVVLTGVFTGIPAIGFAVVGWRRDRAAGRSTSVAWVGLACGVFSVVTLVAALLMLPWLLTQVSVMWAQMFPGVPPPAWL